MIWMDDTYPNSVRRMYEAIDACWTSLCWDDTYGILEVGHRPGYLGAVEGLLPGVLAAVLRTDARHRRAGSRPSVLGFARQQGQHRAPAVQFDRLEDGAQ